MDLDSAVFGGIFQLLIDGVSAPLLYVSPDQLNAIVPFETATGGKATIQVISYGQPAAAWDVPLAPGGGRGRWTAAGQPEPPWASAYGQTAN